MAALHRILTSICGRARMHSEPVIFRAGQLQGHHRLQDSFKKEQPVTGVESFRLVVPLFCSQRAQDCSREAARCVTLEVQVEKYFRLRRY